MKLSRSHRSPKASPDHKSGQATLLPTFLHVPTQGKSTVSKITVKPILPPETVDSPRSVSTGPELPRKGGQQYFSRDARVLFASSLFRYRLVTFFKKGRGVSAF